MARFGESLRERGYDVFVPVYRNRAGLAATAEAIGEFIEEKSLDEYRELHAFAYILGTWALNTYLVENIVPSNLTTIVYDRSPLQERAPSLIAQIVLDLRTTLGPAMIFAFYNDA